VCIKVPFWNTFTRILLFPSSPSCNLGGILLRFLPLSGVRFGGFALAFLTSPLAGDLFGGLLFGGRFLAAIGLPPRFKR
jgi:hypothetical protein